MLANPPDPNTLQAVADVARRRYGLETMVQSYLDLLE
jgi:hypothetical protein